MAATAAELQQLEAQASALLQSIRALLAQQKNDEATRASELYPQPRTYSRIGK